MLRELKTNEMEMVSGGGDLNCVETPDGILCQRSNPQNPSSGDTVLNEVFLDFNNYSTYGPNALFGTEGGTPIDNDGASSGQTECEQAQHELDSAQTQAFLYAFNLLAFGANASAPEADLMAAWFAGEAVVRAEEAVAEHC